MVPYTSTLLGITPAHVCQLLVVYLTLVQIKGSLFAKLDRATLIEMGVGKLLPLSRFDELIEKAQGKQ